MHQREAKVFAIIEQLPVSDRRKRGVKEIASATLFYLDFNWRRKHVSNHTNATTDPIKNLSITDNSAYSTKL